MGQATSTCLRKIPCSGGSDDAGPISDLPDECLASIFQWLSSACDRNCCALVCRRWHRVEGQSRRRLTLKAERNLLREIPSLFSRFDSVTELALRNQVDSPASITDEALVLISQRCPDLTSLTLGSCYKVTAASIESLAKTCKRLKKFSCAYCRFGSKGINALLDNCAVLEILSVVCLTRGYFTDDEPVWVGVAASSLKSICLNKLYCNAQAFFTLVLGAKNLRSLELIRCHGDLDKLFNLLADHQAASTVVEVHLEVEWFATATAWFSDVGLKAISDCCSSLEVLHLVGARECSDVGLVAIAERCKLLRKLHIDGRGRGRWGWDETNVVCDEGLIAVARCCSCLQELVLIAVNPTRAGLEMLASSSCKNLERLTLRRSHTVGDAEISCIAAKCIALKELHISSCPVSNLGMRALAGGCPNLVKVKVDWCKGVTSQGANFLRLSRASLVVDLN